MLAQLKHIKIKLTLPPRPCATESPDPIYTAPVLPTAAIPVLSTNIPVCSPAFAVRTLTSPLLVPNPIPLVTDTRPPLWPDDPPADITISPPLPLSPEPTVMYTLPPFPLEAVPVPTYKPPLSPPDAAPVLSTAHPLDPDVPESAVRISKAPLVLAKPGPVVIEI